MTGGAPSPLAASPLAASPLAATGSYSSSLSCLLRLKNKISPRASNAKRITAKAIPTFAPVERPPLPDFEGVAEVAVGD